MRSRGAAKPHGVRAINWVFCNRETGEITIAQVPNLPLWVFLVASVVGRFAHGDLDAVAGCTATGALGWWAVDEVARGVNPWRRVLGAGGIGLVVLRLVR
jgi:hypothetical protein